MWATCVHGVGQGGSSSHAGDTRRNHHPPPISPIHSVAKQAWWYVSRAGVCACLLEEGPGPHHRERKHAVGGKLLFFSKFDGPDRPCFADVSFGFSGRSGTSFFKGRHPRLFSRAGTAGFFQGPAPPAPPASPASPAPPLIDRPDRPTFKLLSFVVTN